MPSRAVTLAIAAFWLATVGWMVYSTRDDQTDQPPPFTFSLADEVADRNATWEVLFKNHPVGTCILKMGRLKNRVFPIKCEYKVEFLRFDFGEVRLLELTSLIRVSLRGEPETLSAKVKGDSLDFQFHAVLTVDAETRDGPWELTANSGEELFRAKVPSLRPVFNPLQPRFQLPGLFAGQTWTVTALDPLENARPGPWQGHYVRTATWNARVRAVELTRDGEDQSCWRIDYTGAHDKLQARTWARQEDGKVFQQEVYYPEGTLRLVRKLGNKR